MANKGKKKRTVKRPTAGVVSKKKPLRLSQCMIVKNEEKNIEKALSWAKGIAFEQIVVDTGSTDRTVEIAEQMGAKVYYFEWINDFSAAKNYALEQASGEWIAFLDADEYFPKEDIPKLVNLFMIIEQDHELRNHNTAVSCPIVNIDDDGIPFFVLSQVRIFRNTPQIRYTNSIHETLTNLSPPIVNAPELSIIHTGYSASAYADTGKIARNITMLEAELEKDPESANIMCYLADSLLIRGDDSDRVRAEDLYRMALSTGTKLHETLRQGAYNHLIVKLYEDEDNKEESMEICRLAYSEFPDNPDFCYYYGRKLYLNGDAQYAWEKLLECESILKEESLSITGRTGYVIQNPMLLFYQMVMVAEELGDTSEIIRCATLVLKEDKYQHLILAPYIQAFNRTGFETSASAIYELLGKLYNFTNTRDKLTVLQAAKSAGNIELVSLVLNDLTTDELDWLRNV